MRTTKPEDKHSQDREAWLGWVHKYADRLGHQGESRSHEDRARAMNAVNPAFVLRSWIAQDAIEVSQQQQRHTKQQLRLWCSNAGVLRCSVVPGGGEEGLQQGAGRAGAARVALRRAEQR